MSQSHGAFAARDRDLALVPQAKLRHVAYSPKSNSQAKKRCFEIGREIGLKSKEADYHLLTPENWHSRTELRRISFDIAMLLDEFSHYVLNHTFLKGPNVWQMENPLPVGAATYVTITAGINYLLPDLGWMPTLYLSMIAAVVPTFTVIEILNSNSKLRQPFFTVQNYFRDRRLRKFLDAFESGLRSEGLVFDKQFALERAQIHPLGLLEKIAGSLTNQNACINVLLGKNPLPPPERF